jgi:hypothetical protein
MKELKQAKDSNSKELKKCSIYQIQINTKAMNNN